LSDEGAAARVARFADAQHRQQARKSAASSALDCAEGAARQTRADKARAYATEQLAIEWAPHAERAAIHDVRIDHGRSHVVVAE